MNKYYRIGEVGDRITYEYYDKNLNQMVKTTAVVTSENMELNPDANILKIEHPCYEETYVKPEILDNEERKYLSNVIKPFRNKVRHIKKSANFNVGRKHFYEFLSISMPGEDSFDLPYFETNAMYKGMKLDKEYTLEELGLFKK